MKTRFIKIRQDANMTQSQFAEKIGLSRNYVWMMENGERVPSDRTISDICRVFNVQEDWLRHGIGAMRTARSEEEEIATMVASVLAGPPDFQRAVVKMICTRSPEELKVLEKALTDVYENIKKE